MLPRQFESHLLHARRSPISFRSRRFGDAGFAQFRDRARHDRPRRGERLGDRRLEQPAHPDQADDLKAKVLEFMPFGLIPQFIEET